MIALLLTWISFPVFPAVYNLTPARVLLFSSHWDFMICLSDQWETTGYQATEREACKLVVIGTDTRAFHWDIMCARGRWRCEVVHEMAARYGLSGTVSSLTMGWRQRHEHKPVKDAISVSDPLGNHTMASQMFPSPCSWHSMLSTRSKDTFETFGKLSTCIDHADLQIVELQFYILVNLAHFFYVVDIA